MNPASSFLHTMITAKKFLLLATAVATFAACQQDDTYTDEQPQAASTVDADSIFTYRVSIECPPPVYDDDPQTRASATWANGSVVYLRLESGSTYIAGTATYNANTGEWTMRTNSTLSASTASRACYAYYIENPVNTATQNISLNAQSGCYSGLGTYLKPSASDELSVQVSMAPVTWRLRFAGASGSSVRMASDDNEFTTPYTFNPRTGDIGYTYANIETSVGSSGYTPYIYGQFVRPTGSNRLTVVANGQEFYRDFYATNLQAGTSGYFTLPTASNYSTVGWQAKSTIAQDCDVTLTEYVAFTDAVVTAWEMGSNVQTFYSGLFKATDLTGRSDDEIIQTITSGQIRTRADMEGKVSLFDELQSNTYYVFCTIAYDSNGNRGNLRRTQLRTMSTTQPKATISDVQYDTSKWYATLTSSNGATSYYLYTDERQAWYNYNPYFAAYFVRRAISNGNITQTYTWWNTQISWNRTSNASYITICTWAVGSSGIGNYDVFRSSLSNSREGHLEAPARTSGLHGQQGQPVLSIHKDSLPSIDPSHLILVGGE